MYNVLHITTHMGGGVGKALSDIIIYQNNNNNFRNKILLLSKPEKKEFIDRSLKNGVEVMIEDDAYMIEKEMLKADIVVINWWHHPIMAKFLNNFPGIKIRLIVWCHVCGCNYPKLPIELVKLPHKIFFTTKYTLDNPYWSISERKYAKENSEIVYGMGRNNYFNEVKVKKQTGKFVVGYIGTLSNSKIHPQFMLYCRKVVDKIPHAEFVIVGDTEGSEILLKDAEVYGIKDKIKVVGYVNNIEKQLKSFDVFGYPLNSEHFGATENALLEAMAAKVPVVALNQCTEKYIINHMDNGILVENSDDYADKIKYLFDNPTECKRLGENARKKVLSDFSMKQNIYRMELCYKEVIKREKNIFSFEKIFGDKPYKWFLTCLGSDEDIFQKSLDPNLQKDELKEVEDKIREVKYILKGKSKSSINHFYNYYKYDKELEYWHSIISHSKE